jgi:hypothetical protein
MNLFTGGDIGRLNRLIFSPDPVLRFRHENLHEAKKGLAEHLAERDLLLAVLQDGIACFQGYFSKPSRTNEKLFLEAVQTMTESSLSKCLRDLGLRSRRPQKGTEAVAGREYPQSPMGKKTSRSK